MKRILVTGANKGIGLATVEKLLSDYPDTTILLGSRDIANGEQAVAHLLEKQPAWKDRLQCLQIDVSDQESVITARDTVKNLFASESTPLYGIVNNAGTASSHLSIEQMLEVNTWGIARVSEAFIPLLKAGESRIVNVTSASGPNYIALLEPEIQQHLTSIDITQQQIKAYAEECIKSAPDAFQPARGSSYGLTKACANAVTLDLARRHPSFKINACTPGFIETDLTRGIIGNKSAEEMGMKQPKDGANATVFLMMNQINDSGHYFGSDCLRSPLDCYRSPGSPAYQG